MRSSGTTSALSPLFFILWPNSFPGFDEPLPIDKYAGHVYDGPLVLDFDSIIGHDAQAVPILTNRRARANEVLSPKWDVPFFGDLLVDLFPDQLAESAGGRELVRPVTTVTSAARDEEILWRLGN